MQELFDAIQKGADTIANPNWAAVVSAIAAVVAAVAAVGAAIGAIIVAKKQNEIAQKQTDLAEQQNRIALFEKRYKIYSILTACQSFNDIIEQTQSPIKVITYLGVVLSDGAFTLDEKALREAKSYITNSSVILNQADLFFSEDVVQGVTKISMSLFALATVSVMDEQFTEKKEKLCSIIKQLEMDNFFKKIKSEIQCS